MINLTKKIFETVRIASLRWAVRKEDYNATKFNSYVSQQWMANLNKRYPSKW